MSRMFRFRGERRLEVPFQPGRKIDVENDYPNYDPNSAEQVGLSSSCDHDFSLITRWGDRRFPECVEFRCTRCLGILSVIRNDLAGTVRRVKEDGL